MGQHLNVDFKIRLPHELKDKIRLSADEHNRTMTADIVARLEESFEQEQQAKALDALVTDEVNRLRQDYEQLNRRVDKMVLNQDLELVAKMTDEFEKYPQSSILNEILREIKDLKAKS